MTKYFTLFAVLVTLAACAEKPISPPKVELKPVGYEDLKGWGDDRQSEAVQAFARSCDVLAKKEPEAPAEKAGKAQDWQSACQALKKEVLFTDVSARRFFETWFAPYAVRDSGPGLFTGYYEPELNGAWLKGGSFQTPLWQRPDDLITVDLGEFRPDLRGQKVAGKVEGHALRPYDDRAEIAQGSLAQGRARALAWVDNPIDAFFLEIQGSGRVKMPGGKVVRVGYEAQNGKTYVAIGRVLADEGEIEKPVTMSKIRDWLKAHPDRAQAMMDRNPSYVFFRRQDGDGPVGAQGAVLTPGRSLAVDPAFVPLGAPVWLALEGSPPSLVVAQDTGGAIKGPVRGDLFLGAGAEAEDRAGGMQGQGTYYVLLPKTASGL
jgi:membrane-bound lytic murein transglycosylase A